MASDPAFVNGLVAQLEALGDITAKKLFGEWALYHHGRIIAVIADNQLFVKPTAGGRALIGNPEEAPAYPGAKPSFRIDERRTDSAWLTTLLRITSDELPAKKPAKRK
jgi:TfoX/Sxy family transcriptional regulator of competence genes